MDNDLRILKDWDIDIETDGPYYGQSVINEPMKVATIYDWDPDDDRPEDFFLHEYLHIAVRATKTREDEEILVQDICLLIQKASEKE